MTILFTYGGLFCVSFLAATILPMQSEAALVGLLLTGIYSPWLLILVASTGNVLGSVVNWVLGCQVETYRDRKWFPLKSDQLAKAQHWYQHYGRWSLLLSWMPLIGDAITVAAGVMQEKLRFFLPLVIIAKTGRYLVLAAFIIGF